MKYMQEIGPTVFSKSHITYIYIICITAVYIGYWDVLE